VTPAPPASTVPAARRAFDRLAASYDALAEGEIFRLLRARTHDACAKTFQAGCRVLEIGCGTGIDTVFLAGRGVCVLACDPSERMVSCTTRRVAHAGVDARVNVMACGLADLGPYLDAVDDEPGFDGVLSNFGALNCVARLDALGALVARHVRPGGTVMLGLMGRACAWEAFYFTVTGRPRLVRRRRHDGAIGVPVAGMEVPTYFHRIADVQAALGPRVLLTAVVGIGVAVPPPYLEPRWHATPAWIRKSLAGIDRALAPWPPFNRLGDHVLLQFTKERRAHA
jgi:SAM-dependent methyltransferase